MDWNEVERIMERFIRDKIEETGASGVVLGLSGGLDSAVTMKLCVNAIGRERVHALLMPETVEGDENFRDAEEYAGDLGVKYQVFEIAPIVEGFSSVLGEISIHSLGNIKARVRMTLLYGYAHDRGLLVMGTSNKSELLTGYFTKFGDGGVDFMPLGDLYKTEVMEFAKHLGVPEKFIRKKPSAHLYPGQTDEDELGTDYRTLDCILKGIERDMEDERISEECEIPVDEVNRIREMVRRSAHKRRTPLIPKIGLRTVGWDWRE